MNKQNFDSENMILDDNHVDILFKITSLESLTINVNDQKSVDHIQNIRGLNILRINVTEPNKKLEINLDKLVSKPKELELNNFNRIIGTTDRNFYHNISSLIINNFRSDITDTIIYCVNVSTLVLKRIIIDRSDFLKHFKLEKLVIKNCTGYVSIESINVENISNIIIKNTKVLNENFQSVPNKLVSLIMSKTRIDGRLNLGFCPVLETLILNRNRITDLILSAPNLVNIKVSDTRITSIPFDKIPQIKIINAKRSMLTNINGLDKCLNIRKIKLDYCNINDLTPILSIADKLDVISCEGNPLNDNNCKTGYMLDQMFGSNKNTITKNIEHDPFVEYNHETVLESNLNPEVKNIIIEYASYENIPSEYGITFADFFAHIWSKINNHETRNDIVNVFENILLNNNNKSYSGYMDCLAQICDMI